MNCRDSKSAGSLVISTRRLLAVLPAVAVVAAALPFAPQAGAINVSWDDAGGSVSKLWSDFGNWSPDGSPSSDDVFIGNFAVAVNDVTILDQAFTIDSLTLSNGADVITSTDNGATNDFQLTVFGGRTTISGAGSTFFLIGADGDGLDTDGLTINSGGTLNMNATTAQGEAVLAISPGDNIDLNAGGTIIGTGRIDFDGTNASLTNLFSNDGALTANRAPVFIAGTPVADTLRLNDVGDANARFDWDGSGNGTINVNGNQTLDVDISTGSDSWSGDMNLATGSTLDMRDAWSMDSGTIDANTAAFGLIIIGQDPNPGAGAHIAGANWTMSGGTITTPDAWDTLIFDSQVVASGGVIDNNGTMVFNGGASIFSGVDFNMVGADASLIVNSALNIDTPDFNLDGSGFSTNVTTINAGGNLDLDLGAGADEDFHHTINMNGGELDVTTTDNDWNLASTGDINAAGGVLSTINGETFNINGDIDVSGAGSQLNVNAVSSYSSTAGVTIGANSTLNHGTVTYNGGSYTGAGILKKGTATIAGNTTWNVDTVDIDDGSTTINNGATLTINTDSVDNSGDGIDATITIADTGQLQVNLSGGGDVVFDSAGRLVYNGNTGSSNFILAPTTGSALRFNAGSQLNINGDGGSLARIKLSGGTLNINDAAEDFRFEGGTLAAGNTNEIAGGTINGPGELQAGTGHALRGHGTINAQIDFDSTAELVATGGLLDVNGVIQDMGTLRSDGATAVLDLQNAFDSGVTQNGISVLNGGRIQGATIALSTRNLRGTGTVLNRLINDNAVLAQGGTLVLDNTSNDWDGAGNAGILRANTGNLELRDNFGFAFRGTVQADGNREVFANGFELDFQSGSNLILNNGDYRSTSTTDLRGTVTVGAGTANIETGSLTRFSATSGTTLTGTLQLASANTTVAAGAAFAGGGALRVINGSTLNLLDGASVGVLIDNQDTVQIQGTAGVGQVNGDDFQQSMNAELNLDLSGTGLNAFDRMTLAGVAQLDGTLNVDLLGGFNPAIGNAFSLLSAVGGVFGSFSTLDLPGLDPGEVWTLTYNPTSVVLAVAAGIAGDYNNSGQVEQGDLDLVLQNWGDVTPPIPAGWVNDLPVGQIEQTELDRVLQNWGDTAAPDFSGSSVPEPGSAALLAVAAVGLMRRRRTA